MFLLLFVAPFVYFGYNYINNQKSLYKVSKRDSELTTPLRTSIVICAYNEEKYIGKTLDSLFNQNIIQAYPEYFEIIVVDNASEDNTYGIASKYPIKVIKEIRKGKLYAKDTGIKNALGDIVFNCDADTIYPSNYINIMLDAFNSDNDIVGVCGLFTTDGIGTLLNSKSFSVSMPKLFGSVSAFRKQYYNGFNFNVNQLSLKDISNEEEYNFAVRLSKYGKVVLNPDAIAITSSRRYSPFSDIEFKKQIINKKRFGELVVKEGV